MLRDIDIAHNSFKVRKLVTEYFRDAGYSRFAVQEVYYAPGYITLKINNDAPGASDLISDSMCAELTTLLGQLVTPGDTTFKHVQLNVWNRQ